MKKTLTLLIILIISTMSVAAVCPGTHLDTIGTDPVTITSTTPSTTIGTTLVSAQCGVATSTIVSFATGTPAAATAFTPSACNDPLQSFTGFDVGWTKIFGIAVDTMNDIVYDSANSQVIAVGTTDFTGSNNAVIVAYDTLTGSINWANRAGSSGTSGVALALGSGILVVAVDDTGDVSSVYSLNPATGLPNCGTQLDGTLYDIAIFSATSAAAVGEFAGTTSAITFLFNPTTCVEGASNNIDPTPAGTNKWEAVAFDSSGNINVGGILQGSTSLSMAESEITTGGTVAHINCIDVGASTTDHGHAIAVNPTDDSIAIAGKLNTFASYCQFSDTGGSPLCRSVGVTQGKPGEYFAVTIDTDVFPAGYIVNTIGEASIGLTSVDDEAVMSGYTTGGTNNWVKTRDFTTAEDRLFSVASAYGSILGAGIASGSNTLVWAVNPTTGTTDWAHRYNNGGTEKGNKIIGTADRAWLASKGTDGAWQYGITVETGDVPEFGTIALIIAVLGGLAVVFATRKYR